MQSLPSFNAVQDEPTVLPPASHQGLSIQSLFWLPYGYRLMWQLHDINNHTIHTNAAVFLTDRQNQTRKPCCHKEISWYCAFCLHPI